MSAKLKDIAKETGVSVSTASRILNSDRGKRSGDPTVQRVVEVARRLGYRHKKTKEDAQGIGPDRAASATLNIGCILTSEHETFVSPFFSTLLAGIQGELAKNFGSVNNSLYVMNIRDPGFWQFFESHRLDGGIMLGRTSLENIAQLQNRVPRLVYAGVNRLGDEYDEVICDAYEGAVAAVRYLLSLGHKKIGFIGPTQGKHPVFNEHRYRGYLDAMKESGQQINPDYVVDTVLTSSDGYDSARALINNSNLPTALFCGNDTVALGAMGALYESGIMIPDDISIMGFDNIETAKYVKPALTTIAVPTKDLGRLAVKLLLDKIENETVYPVQIRLPYRLIKRESCRPIS